MLTPQTLRPDYGPAYEHHSLSLTRLIMQYAAKSDSCFVILVISVSKHFDEFNSLGNRIV